MKVFLYGFTVGLAVPIVGLLIGMEISSVVGDTLLFPIYVFSSIFDEPFSALTGLEKGVLFCLSGPFYAGLIFVLDSMAKSTVR